jgi:hypothetical protein
VALAFLDREDLAGADASTDAITDDAAVAFAAVSAAAAAAVVEAFFFASCAFEWSICAKRAEEVIDRRFGALTKNGVFFTQPYAYQKMNATNTAIKGIAAKPVCFM